MVKLCGVEDAGRGPVIGPMVIAGVLIDDSKQDELKALGVKDSKLLTPAQRKALYQKVIDFVDDYAIIEISPQEIDAALEDENTNLNWLEAEKFAEAIQELQPERAVVDCPSPNIPAYTKYIQKYIAKNVDLLCEHKADLNHPVVSAASILAKVTRDEVIAKLRKQVGKDFGSGYPSDPKTKAFLLQHHADYPEIFRKSWASYKNVVGNKDQKGLGDF